MTATSLILRTSLNRTPAMRAALYLRRSTDEQGVSLDDQEDEGRANCADRGWPVVEVYRESASGYKLGTPRPALDRMLADAAAGRFVVLVVWRLNVCPARWAPTPRWRWCGTCASSASRCTASESPPRAMTWVDDLQRLIAGALESADVPG
jgi:hypothetical protein